MTAIAWTDVVDIAAELATVAIGAQTMILAHVNTTLVVKLFGGEESPKLKLTRCYLAAHLGTLGPRVGIVTSESELDLAIGYTIPPLPPGDDPFWARTAYGLAYRSMVRSTAARVPFTV